MKYKVVNQVSYADAVKKVQQMETVNPPSAVAVSWATPGLQTQRPSPTPGQGPRAMKPPVAQSRRVQEKEQGAKESNIETLVVEKVSFVAFICQVVNVTLQMDRRSDRIQGVVEAAVKFLGIKDTDVGQIHDLVGQHDGNASSVVYLPHGVPNFSMERQEFNRQWTRI